MQPKLVVEQNVTLMVNQYRVYAADGGGKKGQLVAFAQQKRFAFKEKVHFYTDETRSQVAFTFRAEKVMDIHGRFFIEDAEGNQIGTFRKDFARSLASSTWHIVDSADKPVLTFTESNPTLAALRRYAGFVPIVGEFADIFLAFFRYHFLALDTSGQTVGTYRKTTLFFDRYLLSFTEDAYAAQDWRVLAAVSVALDALQAR